MSLISEIVLSNEDCIPIAVIVLVNSDTRSRM